MAAATEWRVSRTPQRRVILTPENRKAFRRLATDMRKEFACARIAAFLLQMHSCFENFGPITRGERTRHINDRPIVSTIDPCP